MNRAQLSPDFPRLPLLALTILLSTAVSGQVKPSCLTARRWLVSFNPLGLLEPPMAIGLGVGCHINADYEVWSETSILKKGLLDAAGPVNGIREILQLKRFIGLDKHMFLALEARYKYYSFLDSGDFFNNATAGRLYAIPNFQRHFVYGAGLQVGYRLGIGKSERLQLEFSAGLGMKNKVVTLAGVPPGYEYNSINSTDLNVRDEMNTPGLSVYCPGSLRLIYTFGKIIR